jgi:hypothetical protein
VSVCVCICACACVHAHVWMCLCMCTYVCVSIPSYEYTLWGKQRDCFHLWVICFIDKWTITLDQSIQWMMSPQKDTTEWEICGRWCMWWESYMHVTMETPLAPSICCTVRLICVSMCFLHLAYVQNGDICPICKQIWTRKEDTKLQVEINHITATEYGMQRSYCVLQHGRNCSSCISSMKWNCKFSTLGRNLAMLREAIQWKKLEKWWNGWMLYHDQEPWNISLSIPQFLGCRNFPMLAYCSQPTLPNCNYLISGHSPDWTKWRKGRNYTWLKTFSSKHVFCGQLQMKTLRNVSSIGRCVCVCVCVCARTSVWPVSLSDCMCMCACTFLQCACAHTGRKCFERD